jgi:putative Mg2+ transporter-C (MgtC) family protein
MGGPGQILADIFRTELDIGVIVVRLLVAACLGLVIGIDREYRNRSAGLRTHMLVSLAAATFTVLTFVVMDQARNSDNADPIRIIEAVTAGVAFLAAGTIIQSRGQVQGLTTGAGLWLAGAIGLASGLGEYAIAVIATALGLAILVLMSWVQQLFELGSGPDEGGPSEKPSAGKE